MNTTESTNEIAYSDITLHVRYGETDAMGVAYYGRYLDWMEVARTALMKKFGTSYRSLESEGVFLPVTSCGCNYYQALRYDDQILIRCQVTEVRHFKIRFDYTFYNTESPQPIASGYTMHGMVGRDMKPLIERPANLNYILEQFAQSLDSKE